jgi:hypothetical protein
VPTNHPEVIISILTIPKTSNDGTLNSIANHHDRLGVQNHTHFGLRASIRDHFSHHQKMP